MIVALSSIGAAPGVTSWSVLLAAAWPQEMDCDRVVLEADVDGGVLGARFQIGIEPGASRLVSSVRRSDGSALAMDDYGRRVDERVWVVPGPESAEAARQLWSTARAAERVGDSAAHDERVWLVDVGRAGPLSRVGPLVERSSMALVLTRPEHESLVQVPARVAMLKRSGCVVGVLVVGKPVFPRDELELFFDAQTTWVVDSANLVDGSRLVWSERRFKRSQLWRSAVAVASDVADVVAFRPPPRFDRSEVPDGR